MKTTIIVALTPSGGIGAEGEIPWVSAEDMRFFYQETTRAPPGTQNAVIMGRATWESLPRALRGRANVVVSARWSRMTPDEIARETGGAAPEIVAATFEDALDRLEARGDIARAFAIGGEGIFASALIATGDRACEEIVATHILQEVACDRFFPLSLAAESGFAALADDAARHGAALVPDVAPPPVFQPPVEIRRYRRAAPETRLVRT